MAQCLTTGWHAVEGVSPLSDQEVAFLKAVFATGRQTLAQVKTSCSEMSLTAVAETAWFRNDMPDGVDQMNAESQTKSEQARSFLQDQGRWQQLQRLAGEPTSRR